MSALYPPHVRARRSRDGGREHDLGFAGGKDRGGHGEVALEPREIELLPRFLRLLAPRYPRSALGPGLRSRGLQARVL
eukprot:1012283-Rhodomonas_salina.1